VAGLLGGALAAAAGPQAAVATGALVMLSYATFFAFTALRRPIDSYQTIAPVVPVALAVDDPHA
jgi:hypothetical protein